MTIRRMPSVDSILVKEILNQLDKIITEKYSGEQSERNHRIFATAIKYIVKKVSKIP